MPPPSDRRVDEVPERGLHHLDLVGTRVAHVPGQREQPGPGRPALTERGERRATVGHDPRDVGHGLDVVDHRRLAVEADGRREERRLDPREAALALEDSSSAVSSPQM
jgi:hypothetical protein